MKDKMNMKVIGIGGMGINFVNFMIASGVKKVEYITIDTDSKNSERSQAEKKIFLDAKKKAPHLGGLSSSQRGSLNDIGLKRL